MVEHNYQHCGIRDLVSALLLVLLHLAFPSFQQLSRVCARSVPFRDQDSLLHSSVPGRYFRFPTHLHCIVYQTVLYNVQRFAIRQQALEVVQVRVCGLPQPESLRLA